MTVTARIQLSSRDMLTTWNRLLQNSPVLSGESPIGAKAIAAMIVAPSRGTWVCLTTSIAEDAPSRPLCIPTRIPSATTMALSTSMPSAIMRAPREML
ncbi:MAG: hypothetical protein BWY99_00235 [Synergistetes bacterium ADurb.BinA166]|nr:MAG: hypothetical protein BWY99_00235 [Synergistetes bacterium ADurb.BinA166]